jgi:hypothetical protein
MTMREPGKVWCGCARGKARPNNTTFLKSPTTKAIKNGMEKMFLGLRWLASSKLRP